MPKDLAQLAIQSAINGDWEKAIQYNLDILQTDLVDIEALNRLSKAYFEIGELKKAAKSNEKALEIDPYNTIAIKTQIRLSRTKEPINRQRKNIYAGAFIEEPGKTKIIKLIHVSSDKNLACLGSGDVLDISSNGHRISVNTHDGKYIGRLPDDLSARLRKLINRGNNYAVYVKTIEKKTVKVFIRETKRSKELASIPSFSSDKVDYISFTTSKITDSSE